MLSLAVAVIGLSVAQPQPFPSNWTPWEPPNLQGKGWQTWLNHEYRRFDAEFVQRLPHQMKPATFQRYKCWWVAWLTGVLAEMAMAGGRAPWVGDLTGALEHGQKFLSENCPDDRNGRGGDFEVAT